MITPKKTCPPGCNAASLNGQVVAQRTVTSTSNTVIYLHSDHLGSISVATDANGNLVSTQNFTPWGEIRTGGIAPTTLNYTGQQRADTGLLFYHARYYDPALARFLSADSVVPGSADGSLDGIALKPLTLALGEPEFVDGVNQENGQGFWFQLSDQQRQEANAPWGPANAQVLNRYAYVQNNPVRYTDPTGHWTFEVDLGYGFFNAFGVRGNVSVAFDGQGNVGLFLTGGAGAAVGGKGTVIFGGTMTNADTINDLEGVAVQLGGEAAALLGLSLEGSAFRDLMGQLQGGFSAGLAGGFALEIHGTATRLKLVESFNIRRDILIPREWRNSW